MMIRRLLPNSAALVLVNSLVYGVVLGGTGCSSTSASSPPAGKDASGPPLDAPPEANQDVRDSGADPDAFDEEAGVAGAITLSHEIRYGADEYIVSGDFVAVAGPPVGCDGTKVGDCCVQTIQSCAVSRDGSSTCDSGGPASDGGTPKDDAGIYSAACPYSNNLSAGLLQLYDNGQDDGRLVWDPSLGYSLTPPDAGFRYAPGDELGLTGPGSSCFPRVSANVRAVRNLDVSLATPVKASAGLVLSWTPDPNATRVTMALGPNASFTQIITCQVADSAGSLRVPADITEAFGPGSALLSIHRQAIDVSKPNMHFVSEYVAPTINLDIE